MWAYLIPVTDALLEQGYHLCYIIELGLLQHALLGDAVQDQFAMAQIIQHGGKVLGVSVNQICSGLILQNRDTHTDRKRQLISHDN